MKEDCILRSNLRKDRKKEIFSCRLCVGKGMFLQKDMDPS